MRTDELHFDLPPELIAQEPPARRADARLLHYRRADRSIAHRQFSDLPHLVRAGDLLVLNDTRVVPARFTLIKSSGGQIQGLFIDEISIGRWRALLKNFASGELPMRMTFYGTDIVATVVERRDAGEFVIEVDSKKSADTILMQVGRMPLPPYIRRDKESDSRDSMDRERYQTSFARDDGDENRSVAAPTAGLHFTPEIFKQLTVVGVDRTAVTLGVGLGTFKPVTADDLSRHLMHTEPYEISSIAAQKLNDAKSQHRRIIAVGTTSARVLESQPIDQAISARSASTDILISPPYRWKFVDALITNFHLPRSTLIALVAACVGLDEQRRIYQTAIAERYHFFSYGDAMFIE